MKRVNYDNYSVEWDDIYQYWQVRADYVSSRLNAPFLVEHVYVPYDDGRTHIYGYDWIEKNKYKDRMRYVTERPREFLMFGECLNKGTLRTVKMLANAIDEQERAAIWIYAFLFDINQTHYTSPNSIIVEAIKAEALSFLTERFFIWHHAMRKLVPDIYFSYATFENTEFNSFKPLVDLAMVNAAMTLYEYLPVLYNSSREGIKPSSSGNIRRKE